jgi:hypothetical protein
LLAAVLLLVAGCGYHFAASGSALPSSAKTIYVARFSNLSQYPGTTGVNDEFMRYLKDEVAQHKRLALVDDPAWADLSLEGNIRSVLNLPLTFNSVVEPTIYAQSITLDATLKDNRTDQVLWSARRLGAVEQYPVVAQAVITTSPVFLQQNLRARDLAQMPDLQVAATQQHASTEQALRTLAHTLYTDMSEGF